jgi:hypothetical protein
MRRFVTSVYLGIQKGGDHLKTLYTKSETMQQEQFKQNSKLYVQKLILIAFSNILFVFIIVHYFCHTL